MRSASSTVRRVFLTLCACVLLLPYAADAADLPSVVDFDGDGQADQVVADRREPSILHVSLSGSSTAQLIHAGASLWRIAIRDLDGDRLPELIASDSESRIHVWTHKRNRFRPYQPRAVDRVALRQPNRSGTEDGGGTPGRAIASAAFVPLVVAHASRRAPGLVPPAACTARIVRAYRLSAPAVDPFSPRPPPARFPL